MYIQSISIDLKCADTHERANYCKAKSRNETMAFASNFLKLMKCHQNYIVIRETALSHQSKFGETCFTASTSMYIYCTCMKALFNICSYAVNAWTRDIKVHRL